MLSKWFNLAMIFFFYTYVKQTLGLSAITVNMGPIEDTITVRATSAETSDYAEASTDVKIKIKIK